MAFLCRSLSAMAQMVIGADSIAPSAALDLVASNKGFLITRVWDAPRAIANPVDGMFVYDTRFLCFRGYEDGAWTNCFNGRQLLPSLCDLDRPTEVVDVVNPVTGKTWMDRNLGAKRAALSPGDHEAFGWFYQGGRFGEGHQCINFSDSITVSSFSPPCGAATTHQPNQGNGWDGCWITNYPWLVVVTPGAGTAWDGVNAENNPCPEGYRVPSRIELLEEIDSWTQPPINSSRNSSGAWASPLKIPCAGRRSMSGGYSNGFSFSNCRSHLYSSSHAIYSNVLIPGEVYFFGYSVDVNGINLWTLRTGDGLSVRCIKN
jgi:hypothetical protein